MISIQSFADELTKIAKSRFGDFVESHHSSGEKDWAKFNSKLGKPGFSSAVQNHPLSDDKLKLYVKNLDDYSKSKKVVAVVPSRSKSGTSHEIKKLPSGRLGCSCKDWQFVHSVNGTDCFHIKSSKSKEKTSNIAMPMLTGVNMARKAHHVERTFRKGREAASFSKAVTPDDPNRVSARDVKELLF